MSALCFGERHYIFQGYTKILEKKSLEQKHSQYMYKHERSVKNHFPKFTFFIPPHPPETWFKWVCYWEVFKIDPRSNVLEH